MIPTLTLTVAVMTVTPTTTPDQFQRAFDEGYHAAETSEAEGSERWEIIPKGGWIVTATATSRPKPNAGISTTDSHVILISFDGAYRLEAWEDTIRFAKETHCKFTYFVSAPYFVPERELKDYPYWALSEVEEPLVIKFSRESDGRIGKRFGFLCEAIKNGSEVASHLCGHYHGKSFTYGQWMKEFAYFKWAMSRNPDFVFENIRGVRAPYLSVNESFYRALRDSGYEYDSSTGFVQKVQRQLGIEEVPIRNIPLFHARKPLGVRVIPFDDALTLALRDEDARTSEDILFDSLCENYLHGKCPTQVCLHFQLLREEPYYSAVKRFVVWVQDKKPRFATYHDVATSRFSN